MCLDLSGCPCTTTLTYGLLYKDISPELNQRSALVWNSLNFHSCLEKLWVVMKASFFFKIYTTPWETALSKDVFLLFQPKSDDWINIGSFYSEVNAFKEIFISIWYLVDMISITPHFKAKCTILDRSTSNKIPLILLKFSTNVTNI